MLRCILVPVFFSILLVVHARSQPLSATSAHPARALNDWIDDDIFYTQPEHQHDYDTYYWPDETPYPYGGLIPDQTRTRTATSTSSISNASTTASTSTNRGKTTPTPAPVTMTATQPTATATLSEAANTTSSVSGLSGQSSSSASTSDAKQWKVIGLVVICITFVGVMILTIVFFDAWWGFLCAVICRRRRSRGRGIENMVPDWEKRSWEYKFADGDGTFGESNVNSGGSGLAGIGRGRIGDGPLPNPFDPPRPMPVYAPEHDPHPLGPLTRRPSVNARSPLNLPMNY